MKCLTNSAEERIKEAAKKVFLEKGFDGTTTRDIAKEAGLNSALMNYYFRSKEKLFFSVFEEMLKLFFQGMIEILNKPMDFKEKISAIIEHDFLMFKQNANLTNFIHHELHRDPEHFLKSIPLTKIFDHSMFDQQLKEKIEAGEVRPIGVMHVLMLLVSNVQFIFQSKIMTMQLWQMNEEEFEQYAEKHKEIVKEMISSFLFTPVPVA